MRWRWQEPGCRGRLVEAPGADEGVTLRQLQSPDALLVDPLLQMVPDGLGCITDK